MKIKPQNIKVTRYLPVVALAIFFAISPKVYDSYDNQTLLIYFYCLSASLLGVIGIIYILKYQNHSLKITIIDLTVASLVGFVAIYQIFIAKFFDAHILFRYLACVNIFISGRVLPKNIIAILFDVLVFYGLVEVFIVLLEVFKIYSLYADSVHSINGTFGNPNIVAMFLALLVPIAILRYQESKNVRLIYLLSAFLFIFTLVVCKCRSAIIFLIILSLAYAVSGVFRFDKRRFIMIAIFISVLLISLSAVWGNKIKSNTSRELVWKISWEMIRERPVWGYGLTNFEKEYNLYQANYLKSKPVSFNKRYATGYIRQPYNEFFYFWLTGGIIYLVIYLSFGGYAIYYMQKSTKDKNNLILFTSSVSLVCLFFISLFSYTFYVPVIELFLFLHLGIIASHIKPIKAVVINKRPFFYLFALTVLFVGCYSSRQLIVDYRVSKAVDSSNPAMQVKVFEKYYSSNRTNPQFLFNYALALVKERRLKEAILELELTKQYSSFYQIFYAAGICYDLSNDRDQAEENYMTAVLLCPSRFKPQYALFRLYLREENIAKAKEMALKIDKMPITVNSPEIEKIKKEIKAFLTL